MYITPVKPFSDSYLNLKKDNFYPSFTSNCENDVFISTENEQKRKTKERYDALKYLKSLYQSSCVKINRYLLNILDVMASGSVESSNISMLLDMYKEGGISDDFFANFSKEGSLDKNMADDLDRLFSIDRTKTKVKDVFVEDFDSESDAVKNSKTGDVVQIKDEKFVSFVAKDNKILPLKMTKQMYMKLFPPVERFFMSQGQVGDCYLISTLCALMGNPDTRFDILSCFEQQGDDVCVKFPKGSIVYKAKNGLLDKYASDEKLASGCPGLRILEYLYGIELKRYKEACFKNTMDLEIKLLEADLKELSEQENPDERKIADLKDRIYNRNYARNLFVRSLDDPDEDVIIPEDPKGSYFYDEDDGCIFVPLLKHDGKYYEKYPENESMMPLDKDNVCFSPSEYYRGLGGDSQEVFMYFGYDTKVMKSNREDTKSFFKYDLFDDNGDAQYMLMGATSVYKNAKTSRLEAEYDKYLSKHEYHILPFKDENNKSMYKILEPNNSSNQIVLSEPELFEFFRTFSVISTN